MTKFRVYYNKFYDTFFIKRRILLCWKVKSIDNTPIYFRSLDQAKEYISNQNNKIIELVHEE